ncbi:glycosyl transferase [Erwinia sp. CPCC 100877]|nr:glycosyl transferase [Erwinia sp. CPCC 100877]
MTNIDFVLTWVDSQDPDWIADCKRYADINNVIIDELRFRDWENLKYWFRAIEQNAPWVRRIHFVTYGHIPKWLNKEHHKLNIVFHEDFIPEKYLPTFNSHTIELNLHRIDDLSEQFVYFNDDLFIINKVEPSFFFYNGMPCDSLISNTITSSNIAHILLNNLNVINTHFNKKKCMKENLIKWFNYKYGIDVLRNLCLMPWPKFTGFVDPHMANPFLKETFRAVWAKEYEIMDSTCMSKFRGRDDVNQYVFRYWQLANGSFHVKNTSKDSFFYEFNDDPVDINSILNGRHRIVCLNDGNVFDFHNTKNLLINELDIKFPKKSEFEK